MIFVEVKINKEIRNYTESVFFGLTLRQFVFSLLACIIAVILYFILKPYFAISELSWMCILGATPCAVLGFVTYNGMNAEQFIVQFIKSEILMPKDLKFQGNNYYDNLLKATFEKLRKRGIKEDEISRKEKRKNRV